MNLLLPGPPYLGRDWSSLFANGRRSSGTRGSRSLGPRLFSHERPSAPSSNRRNSEQSRSGQGDLRMTFRGQNSLVGWTEGGGPNVNLTTQDRREALRRVIVSDATKPVVTKVILE